MYGTKAIGSSANSTEGQHVFRNTVDTMYSLCTMKVLTFHGVCLWKLGLDKIVLCFSTEIDHRIGQDLLMLGHVICSPIVGSSLGLSCTGGHFLMVCVCVGGGGEAFTCT